MVHLVIVGSGIIGLAHAVIALEKGWTVSVFERHSRPLGASVRNFGAIWPIGQPIGPVRNRALRSAQRWQALSKTAGFSCENRGALHLAYSDEAWQVLSEFEALLRGTEKAPERVTPEEIHQLAPQVIQGALRGGLFSDAECVVVPGQAIRSIIDWLQARGVTFHFNTPIIRVREDEIRTSEGTTHRFDQLLVCSGDETRLLYPDLFRTAGVRRVKLQMMQTVPQPAAWTLSPIVVSEPTLAHYGVFAACPSREKLARRLYEEAPRLKAHAIHVMAVQQPSGALVVGDSHHYGVDFSPAHEAEIESLIMAYLQRFLHVAAPTIQSRWNGYYLQAPAHPNGLVLRPQSNIRIITGLGGAGMTQAFGLAEELD